MNISCKSCGAIVPVEYEYKVFTCPQCGVKYSIDLEFDAEVPIEIRKALAELKSKLTKEDNCSVDELALYLSHCSLQDEDFELVAKIKTVNFIDLNYTDIGDKGLKYFSDLPNLEQLNLMKTYVGDDGIAYLVNLPKLSSLNLFQTDVSDDGIDYLIQMNKLEQVDIRRTLVTEEGYEKLKAASPSINVSWE